MGSISTVIKDVFSSTDVGGFGFDEFYDNGGGLDELQESWLGNLKPVFISATVIDSHGCFNNFVKKVFVCFNFYIGSFLATILQHVLRTWLDFWDRVFFVKIGNDWKSLVIFA